MPANIPVLVNVTSPAAREMPKSVILAVPSSAISTFPGLTSRCTTPAACAAANADAACAPIRAASAGGSSRPSPCRSDRLRDGRYSITNTG
ncbi:hypothetical protein BJF85_09620 [Saccharomonospora sp. CUA-673]|nr:hypothetical protein BJF85_09620 [Saccharomonospora sp. CUA-673]